LINLRGEIVLLLDTAILLGVDPLPSTPFAVVLNTPHGPVGLTASALPERGVLDSPAGPSQLPGSSGMFRFGPRVAVLLNPAALLTVDNLGGHGLGARSDLAGVA
jgi:chemotaxis signal transduction protein